jgi:hypothetical protein
MVFEVFCRVLYCTSGEQPTFLNAGIYNISFNLVLFNSSLRVMLSCCFIAGSQQTAFKLTVALQEDNRKLVTELQSAVSQNTDITEKFVRSELSREQLRVQLHELKQKTGYANQSAV